MFILSLLNTFDTKREGFKVTIRHAITTAVFFKYNIKFYEKKLHINSESVDSY